ncbi:MAG: transposase [Saprospiraceae bacterium]
MDTVTAALERIPPELLEKISINLVKGLLRKRLFHQYRLLNKYFLVAIDATGYASYEKAPNWPCPHKTSKKGKTWWTQPILCAKLVLPNGLSIPLLTEWIINEAEYDKQDCETKAFKRLAPKLKAYFPQLSICILADGLYTTGPFFEICKQHKWSFIVVFKDTQLSTVWEQVEQQKKPSDKEQDQEELSPNRIRFKSFQWVNGLTYQGHSLHWAEANIEDQKTTNQQSQCQNKHRFVCLTDLKIDKTNVEQIVQASRLRWKIENEGFNIQKNGGYKLQHKMSRTNFFAVQNFLTCLQIGHLINQLITCSQYFKKDLQQNFTLKHCWEVITAFLLYGQIECLPVNKISFRYN